MDESTYLIIFVVLIVLIAISILLNLILSGGVNTNIEGNANGINKNISRIGISTSNTINTTLTPLGSSLSNTINTITPTLNSATANIIKVVSNNTASVDELNKNISVIGSSVSSSATALSGINSNLTSLPSKLESNINSNLTTILANIITNKKGSFTNNTIMTWNMTQSIAPSNYIVYGLPDTFLNHVKLNASAPVLVTLVSIFQFANFTNGKSYGNEGIYTSTGSFNSIDFDVSLSTGCSLYEIVITGNPSSNTAINIYPNVTSTYQPSAALQGVC